MRGAARRAALHARISGLWLPRGLPDHAGRSRQVILGEVALLARVVGLSFCLAGCVFDTSGIFFGQPDAAREQADAARTDDAASPGDAPSVIDGASADAQRIDAPPQSDSGLPFCPSTLDLVGCYRFEGNGEDGSLSNADAELTAVAWGTGVDGSAVETDSASVIYVPDHVGLDVPALTAELWVRPAAFPTGSARAGLIDSDGQYGLFIYAGGEVRCSCAGVGVSYQSIELDAWVHIACTYDPIAGLILHIDGSEEDAVPPNGMPSTGGSSGLSIAGNNPSGDPFTGRIDSVRIWNRARSESEICADANSC